MEITNIKYSVDGMRFDAAVDWNWEMHYYGIFGVEESNDVLPIELYCIDNPDWDVRMMFQKSRRHGIDFDAILEETREWITDVKG